MKRKPVGKQSKEALNKTKKENSSENDIKLNNENAIDLGNLAIRDVIRDSEKNFINKK